MKLTIFNGSPRGVNSSSKLLADHFLKGFGDMETHEVKVEYLTKTRNLEQQLALFEQSDEVIFIFPLYFDSLPYCGKNFFESLAPYIGKKNLPAMGFFVHSGFPEANQSRLAEKYLEKLTSRLGAKYLGTVIKGNTEGFTKIKHRHSVKKVLKMFEKLGAHYSKTGKFDKEIVKKFAMPEKIPAAARLVMKLLSKIRVLDHYWCKQLKKNKAYKERYNRPFLDKKQELIWEKIKEKEME